MIGTAGLRRLTWLTWLAPVGGGVAVVVAYRTTYASEAGLYAGAEPGLAGALVATPFVALAMALLGCAVGSVADPSVRRRPAWVVLCAVLAAVTLAGVIALRHS